MALIEFKCKFCKKSHKTEKRNDREQKYCSQKCSKSDPEKRNSLFSWDYADKEETRAKTFQNFYRNLIIKNGCWDYKCNRKEKTYISIEIGKRKYDLLHRVSYELHYGKIPKGLLVRHLCNNPWCCRPSHLEIGTHQDNCNDKVKANRQSKGKKHGMSKLSEKEVFDIKKLLLDGNVVHKEIGNLFGVSKSCITKINMGTTWAHINVDGFKPTKGKKLKGELNGSSKLTEEDVKEIKNMLSRGERLCEICKKYNVNSTTIARIRDGKTWTHVF